MLTAQQHTATTQPIAATFDEDGFITNKESWTKTLAEQIALREGVGNLTERHWVLLTHLRAKYENFGGTPSLRSVCRSSGLSKHAVYEQFGNCLSFWKIAGLPDPGEEAKAYMG